MNADVDPRHGSGGKAHASLAVRNPLKI
jgi:hypothetical protein